MSGQPDRAQQSHSKVFISYSHKDKKHLERLQIHLEPYHRAGIEVWDDTRIRPGQQWRQEIADALASVKIAILLVSADFMASKFIVDHELPSLLAATRSGGATILPVVVGACNFTESELAEFQAINDPSKPVGSLPRHKREEIWSRVAKVVADTLSGPLYTGIEREMEANLGSSVQSGQQTVLGDELDTLIALQETLKNAPKDTHFPYFVRPLGPLFASNEPNLRKAGEIRRRVIRMFIEEADKELAPDDKASDHYHGYNPHSACPVADFGYFAFAMRAVLTAILDERSEFKVSFASWRCRQETSAVVPAARRCMRFGILGSLRHQGCSSVETALFSGFPQKSKKCTKRPCGMWDIRLRSPTYAACLMQRNGYASRTLMTLWM